jgi:hypothetical protein
MRTCILVKLLIVSILINYALTYTVSGTCQYGTKKWDCQVKTTTGWQVEVSGTATNFPDYNYSGAIKLPYGLIESATQEVFWTTWLIFPDPYTVVTINLNKGGVKTVLTVSIDDTASANYIAAEMNIYRAQKQAVLKVQKASIISQASSYNTKVDYLNTNKDSYSTDSARINYLNNEISTRSTTITSSTNDRDNLVIENNKLQPSVASLQAIRDSASKSLSDCRNEANSYSDMLQTYQKYNAEFSDDDVASFLDKEYNNLCQFHLAAEDIILILPTEVNQINKVRKEITTTGDISSVTDLFNSDDFYILKDFN